MENHRRIKARFLKVRNDDGSQNFEKSFWEVSSYNEWDGSIVEVLLKISVEDICKLHPEMSYVSIATMEFGKSLILKTKKMAAFW